MQEALARQEQAAKETEGRCLAAEQEARQQRARAGELHVRCLSAEERSAALYGEAVDLQGALAQGRAELAQLRDEGVALHDRAAVHNALAEVLRGCGAPCSISVLAWLFSADCCVHVQNRAERLSAAEIGQLVLPDAER